MKRSILLIVLAIFIFQAENLFPDINRSVLKLLSSLSRQYRESEQEIFFKKPLAVIPFVDSSPASKEYEIGSVVEELIRKEISRSTYFILTERKNLDKILKEIELSLSDIASGESSLEVGKITGAEILLAGSITESRDDFILNARLIDVESSVVMGAESVPVPKAELIGEAQAARYEYVSAHGLGFFARVGTDLPIAGVPSMDKYKEYPVLINLSTGVSYRLKRFLQLCASVHAVWTEFQLGEFNPASSDYDNSDLLKTYFTANPGDYPSYGYEYSQKYIDIQALFVLNPIKRLALSMGGGGLIGMWSNYIKMNDLPVYIGTYTSGVPDDPTVKDKYITKSVVINSGNGALFGFLVTLKAEYFFSPRILLFLAANYRKVFAGDPYRYTIGGTTCGTGGDEGFKELSGWIPGKTPYGDSLELSMDTIGISLGISISF